MNDTIKFIINFPSAVLGLTLATLNPLLIIPGLTVAYNCTKNAANALNGNYIKNSCFQIKKDKKNKQTGLISDEISQSAFMAKDFVLSRLEKDHMKYFQIQTLNMFQQLNKERDGKKITYSCTSQSYTKFLLKKMEKLGYINNLSVEKCEKKSTINLARFLLGVKKRDKEIKMWNMNFELTDKKFDGNAACEMLNSLKIDTENLVKKDKKNLIFFKNKLSDVILKTPKKVNNEKNLMYCDNNISNINLKAFNKLSLIKDNIFKINKPTNQETNQSDISKTKSKQLDELKNFKKNLLELQQYNNEIQQVDYSNSNRHK